MQGLKPNARESVLESIAQAIVTKDARSLRHLFVNRAAEVLMGLPRAQAIGKSVRDLFPEEAAETIERQDSEALAGTAASELIVLTGRPPTTVSIALRCLRITDQSSETMLINIIEDRTDQAEAVDAAA